MTAKPDCWSWPVTDDDRRRGSLHLWQAGRCAVCSEVGRLFRDHDHDSGWIRGLLCRACNAAEWSGARLFDRYRKWCPAKILALWSRYESPVFGLDWGTWAGVKLEGPVPVSADGTVLFESAATRRHAAPAPKPVALAATDLAGALADLLDSDTYDLVLGWLSNGRRAAKSTQQGYVDDLAKIAGWAARHFGVHPVPLLKVMDFEAVSAWSTSTCSQGLAPRTQRRALSALSSLFTYAARHGCPVPNPVSWEDHARQLDHNAKRLVRVLTDDEVVQLRSACQTAEEQLVFALIHQQGMRESEVTDACAEHIDWGRSPAILKVRRRNGKWYELPLGEETRRFLGDHLGARMAGPLLVDEDGQPRTRFHLINLTRRLARRADVAEPNQITAGVLRAAIATPVVGAAR